MAGGRSRERRKEGGWEGGQGGGEARGGGRGRGDRKKAADLLDPILGSVRDLNV